MSEVKYNLVGKKFFRLRVLERAENKNKRVFWKCICDCGKILDVNGEHLRNGTAKSCGCLNKELARERMLKIRKELGLERNYESETRLYSIWQNMKARCDKQNNKVYNRYGGRGITYAREWKTYEPFMNWTLKNGYKENLSLDRINNNGNYEPLNCRWISHKEQCRNKSTNRILEYKGKNYTMVELAEELGISYSTLKYRVNKGMAYDTPLKNSVARNLRIG